MSLRLAVLAAFPFPLPQGSQVYVAEQAHALSRAGVDVTLLCYGHGARDDALLATLRAAGVILAPAAAALSRTRLGAGPSVRKPLADTALLARLLAAEHRQPFDAILAHNIEAACIALASRTLTGTPVVYVAHTLFGSELSAYVPEFAGSATNAVGRRLDQFVARWADAVITLSTAATATLDTVSARHVSHIPPALDPAPAPASAAVHATCREHGLEPGAFAVYAGNLDAYQDLALLAAAARQLGQADLVAVTHDPRRSAPPGLRLVRARDAAEVRRLLFGAALAVVPRRISGGFPIKILNYLEAGLAILAFEDVADGLRHGFDAWLLPRHAGADALASAIRSLRAEPALASRLGANARRLLEARFGWKDAIPRTLGIVTALADARREGRRESADAKRIASRF